MDINIYEERLAVQKGMVDYFGDVVVTKCREIDETDESPSYSLYYARIGCLLCIDDRYIVIIVEGKSYPSGHQTRLSTLNWTSFQTRTIDKAPKDLKTQTSKSKITSIVASKIKLSQKRDDRYVYFAENVPLTVELLFTKNEDSYAESGTIQSALDTYNCVLSFTI
jgi:hypothetical protein